MTTFSGTYSGTPGITGGFGNGTAGGDGLLLTDTSNTVSSSGKVTGGKGGAGSGLGKTSGKGGAGVYQGSAGTLDNAGTISGGDGGTGGVGNPVWLLLAHATDWRWLSRREDSPWYPNHRLFRQERPGAWGPVFDRIARALAS
jgi:hypothetical protein